MLQGWRGVVEYLKYATTVQHLKFFSSYNFWRKKTFKMFYSTSLWMLVFVILLFHVLLLTSALRSCMPHNRHCCIVATIDCCAYYNGGCVEGHSLSRRRFLLLCLYTSIKLYIYKERFSGVSEEFKARAFLSWQFIWTLV